MRRTLSLSVTGWFFGLLFWAAASGGAETVDFSGYLFDERTDATFDVYAETRLLEVTFTYPATSDFRVKVLGESGKELGDFDLGAEGPVIQVKGGGRFTFVVYTESGGGTWTAFYER
ncbi:MAG: hypothetical protein GTN49_02005 [candidate division Zixibacteria bacterium]|nr:hypothetical protein [candidate division Zixibacteria bacterium]